MTSGGSLALFGSLVLSRAAPAKLNPFLRVLGRRDDGYHDIETLVLPLSLADEVQVRPAPRLELTVRGELADEVPSGRANLALAAAEELARISGASHGATIDLWKRIPVTAGLGGGSADAAAVLLLLGRLWDLDAGMPLRAAQTIGSDVPALLHGGPVVATGRGERLKAVEVVESHWVLVTQPFGVPAGDAYRWWDEDEERSGPDPVALLGRLIAGDLHEAAGLLFNDLEPVVAARYPAIRTARERLAGAGALGVVMCGSGPTVAGLCRDREDAEAVAAAVGGIAVSSVG